MYRIVTRLWETEKRFFWFKSRQIMMSWTFAGLHLWDIMFQEYRRDFFQCLEESSSAGLVDRARFIATELINNPIKIDDSTKVTFPEICPGFPAFRVLKGRIGTDDYIETIKPKSSDTISGIYVVPKGVNVARSYTISRWFADELPHQSWAAEAYGAANPATEYYSGGGTPSNKSSFAYKKMFGVDERTGQESGVILVDSYDIRQPRFTEDQILNMSREEFYGTPIAELVACIPGMHYWEMKLGDERTPVLSVHYSADPEKRPGTLKGDAWIAQERAKCSPTRWRREYDLQWDVYDGQPVVTNWREEIFVRGTVRYQPGQLIGIGIDFGTEVCGGILAQMHRTPGFDWQQLHIIDEVILRNSNTVVLAKELKDRLQRHYRASLNRGNLMTFPDPAGHMRKSTTSDRSLNTDIKILRGAGMPVNSKKVGVPESLEFVATIFQMASPSGEPAVLVHPRCKYTRQCLEGGWCYRKDAGERKSYDQIEPNDCRHGGDMIRYLFSNMFAIERFIKQQVYRPPVAPVIKVHHPFTGALMGYRRNVRTKNRGVHGVA
jgi:hypothetical protein